MTTLNLPGNGTEDYVVSGFYGPGGWAAWCISLVASWAPILLEDYTHNLHLIAYALYMNWAAVDCFRSLSLRRTYDEMATRREKLERGSFFSIKNRTDTVIVQRHWPSDVDQPGLRSFFELSRMGNFTREVRGTKIRLASETSNLPGIWDLYTLPTTKDLTNQLQSVETRIEDLEETLQKQESSILNQAHQLQAAMAILNLGMLHSWVQLLICGWRAYKISSTETATLFRRRNLVILMGLIVPSIVQLTDLMFHNRDIMTGWSVPAVWTTVILLATTYGSVCNTHFTPLLPSLGRLSPYIFGLIWALIIAGLYALVICSSPCSFPEGRKGPRCGLIPRTSSKITEMDQAFAAFAALLFFFYDFRFHFWKLIKFLRSRFEKLFVKTQPSSTTSAGAQPVNSGS